MNDQQQRDASGPESASALGESIEQKVAELAALLVKAGKTDREVGVRATQRAINDLTPAEQGALRQAHGGNLRAQLLDVFLTSEEDSHAPKHEFAADERVDDRELIALVQRLFRQFVSIESAVVAISTEFMHEGQKVKLPGHFANLRGYVLQLLHDGGDTAVDKVNNYLGDINRWIAASLRAWELAPEEWWKQWWERINPSELEQKVQVGFMGNKYREFWKQYEEKSRHLTPPEAKSQIFEIAGRIAREAMS